MLTFLGELFDTTDFPPRWSCGAWTSAHGWLHILADLGVWSAYFAIPCVLLYFTWRRRDLPFRSLFWLFGAFILACGTTHLMEAIIFWWPAYRLAGLIKLATAVVSWTAVFALIRVIPHALALRSPLELEREIAERRRAEQGLVQMQLDLERHVATRTAELERTNASLKAEVLQREHAEAAMRHSLAEQARAEASLRDADRRKDEFLAILGHELRNPLAGIVGAVQALEYAAASEVEAREMRAIIQRQSQHMSRLLDDLLEVSRISRGKVQLRVKPVQLVELVQDTCQDLRPHVEKNGLAMRVELPCEPLWVHGDPTRLAQILTNLVQNAAKFTDTGGAISIRLVREREGACELIVSDTGIGMKAESLPRIFEPFRQADESADYREGGLGLGLALVKGLTELHGGQVSAASPGLGLGSEFRVRLPLMAPPEPSLGGAAPLAPLPEQTLRILVIDDRRDTSYPMQALLKRMGHHVEMAEDGHQGILAAKRLRPDLVLCDIGLPDVSGYDVAHALRSDPETRQIHLVAVTGHGQESDRRRAAEAGFDQHLVKPVGMPALKEILAAYSAALGVGP